MTSSLTDSAGVEFDPAIHQHAKDGTPRTTKDGRFFAKGKRGPGAKKSPAGPTARTKPPAAPAPDPSPSPVAPGELPPLQMQPATERDILGDFAKPTISPGAAEPVPEAAPPPEGAAPMVSDVAPDPAAAAPGAPSGQSLAVVLVGFVETSARVGIDPGEWELAEPERDRLTAAVDAVLAEEGVGQNISPKGALMLELSAVAIRRAHKPKTRAWLFGLVGWVRGLFAPKKTPAQAIDRPAQPVPGAPRKADKAPDAPAKATAPAKAPVEPGETPPDLSAPVEVFPA